MPNSMFSKFMRDEKLRTRMVDRIRKQPLYKNADSDDLEYLLKNCDKATFAEFRKKDLTIAQLKAKIFRGMSDVKYECYDDIK